MGISVDQRAENAMWVAKRARRARLWRAIKVLAVYGSVAVVLAAGYMMIPLIAEYLMLDYLREHAEKLMNR